MRHILKLLNFSVEGAVELLSLAGRIEKNRAAYAKVMEGKKLTTLLYEPNAGTRLSFKTAMLSLGESVLGFQSADASSTSKGGSVADTVRVVPCYADIIAIRHPKEGALIVISGFSYVPVINTDDEDHQHPAQTLTDLMTMQSLRGRLDHMTVKLCGDPKFDRTVHSLISSLTRYPDIHFVLISPPELRIPSYIREDVLEKSRIPFTEVGGLEASMPDLDILYMTCVQKERFFSEEDYIHLEDSYILTKGRLKDAEENMFILHLLPRVNEIAVEVDKDPRIAYFKQVQYGVYVRMALVMKLLEIKETC